MSSYYEYSYVMEELLDSGVLASLLSGIPSTLISIASYVLTALALYTIAKRRGLNKPWLAWIPVADAWLLGSLSDQYRYVVKGQNKSKRKALLLLRILSVVLGIAMISVAVGMMVGVIGAVMRGATEAEMLERVLGPVMGLLGMCVPMAAIGIAYAIIYFMALYDVYTSCDPGNNVLFLVLSILIGVTRPFFLFFSRNKDNGMPPRRPEPVSPTPLQEPWEQEHKDYL